MSNLTIMPDALPRYVSLVFEAVVLLTFLLFLRAVRHTPTKNNKLITGIGLSLSAWMLLQSLLAGSGFFRHTESIPPRIALIVLPAFLVVILSVALPRSRNTLARMPLHVLTWVHIVRVPVEVVLVWLFSYHYIPQGMTFKGHNGDLFSGLTAPLVAYWGFYKRLLPRWVLIAWNIICLVLLANVVTTGILSFPGPLQQINFDQPNLAIMEFPFVLLPGFIVPLVVFCHLVALVQLFRKSY